MIEQSNVEKTKRFYRTEFKAMTPEPVKQIIFHHHVINKMYGRSFSFAKVQS